MDDHRHVAPLAGAWIETTLNTASAHSGLSPPSRGRGSKHGYGKADRAIDGGRPPRGGVDRNTDDAGLAGLTLSRPPRGGVDRNAPQSGSTGTVIASPPSRGRGSKRVPEPRRQVLGGRPPRGGVDRNPSSTMAISRRTARVAPLAGAWIETSRGLPKSRPGSVAPLAGAWIETTTRLRGSTASRVAPLAGAWIETNVPPASSR